MKQILLTLILLLFSSGITLSAQGKFDKEKIIFFNDVRDAYPYLNTLALNEEVYALFENDLLDTFNEK